MLKQTRTKPCAPGWCQILCCWLSQCVAVACFAKLQCGSGLKAVFRGQTDEQSHQSRVGSASSWDAVLGKACVENVNLKRVRNASIEVQISTLVQTCRKDVFQKVKELCWELPMGCHAEYIRIYSNESGSTTVSLYLVAHLLTLCRSISCCHAWLGRRWSTTCWASCRSSKRKIHAAMLGARRKLQALVNRRPQPQTPHCLVGFVWSCAIWMHVV